MSTIDSILEANGLGEQPETVEEHIEEPIQEEQVFSESSVEDDTLPETKEEQEVIEATEPETEEEATELPENPTNADFAKQRMKERDAKNALKAEKERADKLEAMLAQLAGNQDALSKIVQNNNKPQEQKQDTIPDAVLDPEGWAKWQQEQRIKQDENSQQLAQRLQAFEAEKAITRMERVFAREVPDFSDAKDFYISKRVEAYRTLYPNEPIVNIEAHVENEYIQDAQAVAQNNMDPAEALYREAIKLGFQGKPDAPTGSGSPLANSINEKPKTNMQKLQEVKSRSKGTIGGGRSTKGKVFTEPMSIGQLARMNSSDVNSYFDQQE